MHGPSHIKLKVGKRHESLNEDAEYFGSMDTLPACTTNTIQRVPLEGGQFRGGFVLQSPVPLASRTL